MILYIVSPFNFTKKGYLFINDERIYDPFDLQTDSLLTSSHGGNLGHMADTKAIITILQTILKEM